MGRKNKWFSAVKKVFSPQDSETKPKNHNSKKKWKLSKSKISDPSTSTEEKTNDDDVQPPASSLFMDTKQFPPPAEVMSSSPVAEITMPSPVNEVRPSSSLVEVKLPSPDAEEVKLPPPPVEVEQTPIIEVKQLPLTTEIWRPLPLVEVKPHTSKEFKLKNMEDEHTKHAYSVALASAVAAEAAAVAAQAAAEVARLATCSKISSKLRDEVAATKIQAAFRGYLVRKELQALRGLFRLKKLVDDNVVKHQTTYALRSIQTLSRVHAQIRARRMRMKEEHQAFQRQLMLKREKEIEKLKIEELWDDSLHSKEKIEAKILNKHEASIRREKALAYAFSHQWKSASREVAPMFSDLNNVQWGWSWLECWMAARPWENHCSVESRARASQKTASCTVDGPTVKTLVPRDSTLKCNLNTAQRSNNQVPCHHLPSTPPSQPSSVSGKKKSASPKGVWASIDSDSRSIVSTQSKQSSRHSLASSSLRDNESLASAPVVPNYMTPTESTRAKSRFSSRQTNLLALEKGSISSKEKRLSFPPSPSTPRRYSAPPRVGALHAE